MNIFLRFINPDAGFRLWFLLGALVCVVLLGIAFYFEYVLGLEPCPLCAVQRFLVMILGVLGFAGFLHNPSKFGTRIYAGLGLLFTLAGLIVTGRHIWLQNLPSDQVPDCGPGLEFILQTFPLFEALELIFKGSGECAEVQWVFLGLTIPGWTFVIFSIMLLAFLYMLFRRV